MTRNGPLASQDPALGTVLMWTCFLRQGSLLLNPEPWRNVMDVLL